MTKNIIFILLSAVCLIMTAVSCSDDSSSRPSDHVPSTAPVKADSWMLGIADSVNLANMSIPGTHDSGTYLYNQIQPSTRAATCQYKNVKDQLNAGARVFDLRLGIDESGNLKFWHGDAGAAPLTFETFILDMDQWIREHPSEAIILIFKVENWDYATKDQVMKAAEAIIYDNGVDANMIMDPKGFLALGDSRGKMLYYKQDNGAGDHGTYFHWNQDCTPLDLGWGTIFGEDQYKKISTADKKDWITKNITKALESTSSTEIFITFASGYDTLIPEPFNYSQTINPWLSEKSYKIISESQYGIVMCDFLTGGLSRVIYMNNYDEEYHVETGYWVMNDDGGIDTIGDAPILEHGSGNVYVAIAVTPSGQGYFLAESDGGIDRAGDAVYRGHDKLSNVVDMDVTATNGGYMILEAGGGIHVYGDAVHLGHGTPSGQDAVALGYRPDGRYNILGDRGGVESFGDPMPYYGHEDVSDVVDMALTKTGEGYWIVTGTGKVYSEGDALDSFYGSPKDPNADVVAIKRSATGDGYYILFRTGQVEGFGDAMEVGYKLGQGNAQDLGIWHKP